MPYIKDKNLVNIYEEVDKANQTISKLNDMLREEEENNSILKKHRIILGAFGLLLLLLFLWSFLPKSNKIDEKYLQKNNLTLVDIDTLEVLQDAASFTVNNEFNGEDIDDSALAGETIIYSIQIGAFTNFKAKLFSDDLAHMKEFEEGGLNNMLLENFITYTEAIVPKRRFKKPWLYRLFHYSTILWRAVNIREALELSEETQYLN